MADEYRARFRRAADDTMNAVSGYASGLAGRAGVRKEDFKYTPGVPLLQQGIRAGTAALTAPVRMAAQAGRDFGGATREAATDLGGQVAAGLRSGLGMQAAQPVQPESLFIDGTQSPYGATLVDQPQTGYRIVQGGESPILTNVEGYPEQGGNQFIQSGGMRLGLPAGEESSTMQSYANLRDITATQPQVVEPVAPTGLRRQPRTMADILAGVRTPRGAGAMLAAGLASKFSQSEISAANREENLNTRDARLAQGLRALRISENNAGTNRINALANVNNARTAEIKAFADAGKSDAFVLTPPKPDTTALPDKTGKYPMLNGSVKIGKTEYSMSAEDFSAAQELANRYVAQYKAQYPDAAEDPEVLLNKFGQQAVMDVLAQRGQLAGG